MSVYYLNVQKHYLSFEVVCSYGQYHQVWRLENGFHAQIATAHKTKMLKTKQNIFCFKISDSVFILLINVKDIGRNNG